MGLPPRREPPPCDRLIARTGDGIPCARPEVVLLFKATAARPHHDGDFAAVLPRLAPDRRRKLAEALYLGHPGPRWPAALRSRPDRGRGGP